VCLADAVVLMSDNEDELLVILTAVDGMLITFHFHPHHDGFQMEIEMASVDDAHHD